MVQNLKLFYYRRADGQLNFGDDLSPIITSYVSGRPIEWSPPNTAELIGLGSILHLTKENLLSTLLPWSNSKEKMVWGAGIISGDVRKNDIFRKLNYLSVRGPLTRDLLGLPKDITMGDPGLIVGEIFPRRMPKHDVGVVLHYSHKSRRSEILEAWPFLGARFIDVEDDAESVVASIAECRSILSSSLHGLVVADALGIPNMKLPMQTGVIGGDFKYRDYFGSIGRDFIEFSGRDDLEFLLESGWGQYQENIDRSISDQKRVLNRALKK
jgi:hypothetical protein